MAPMIDAERGSGDNTVLQLEQQQEPAPPEQPREYKAAAATLRDTTAAIASLPDPMDQSERAIQETEKLLLQAQKALESTRLITQKAAAKNQSSAALGSRAAYSQREQAISGASIPEALVEDPSAEESPPTVSEGAGVSIVSQSDAEEEEEEENTQENNINRQENGADATPSSPVEDDMPGLKSYDQESPAVIEPDTPLPKNEKSDTSSRERDINHRRRTTLTLVEAEAQEKASAAAAREFENDSSVDLDQAMKDKSEKVTVPVSSLVPKEAPVASIAPTRGIVAKPSTRKPYGQKIVEETDLDESFVAPLRGAMKAESKAGMGTNTTVEAAVDASRSDESRDGASATKTTSLTPDRTVDLSEEPSSSNKKKSINMRNRLSRIGRSLSSQSLTSGRSKSPTRPPAEDATPARGEMKRSNSFKGMWKGIKKKISGKRGGKSPPPPKYDRTRSAAAPDFASSLDGSNPPLRRVVTTDETSSAQPRRGWLTASSTHTGGGGHKRPSRQRSSSEEPARRSRIDFRTSTTVTATDLLELERIAKAVKDNVQTMEYFETRKQKKYKNCFYGSAVVDFLCQCTRTTRSDATEIGRELVQHFGLFVPTTVKMLSSNGTPRATGGNYLLQDSNSTVYRFMAFLPSEVQKMNLEAKSARFEDGVSVKDRRLGLRKYKKCFIGAEAVSYLVKSRLVKSRSEALDLGRRFIIEFNLFEPVNRDHDFIDSRTKFYRFVDKKYRYFSINNMLSTRLIQMGQTTASDVSDDDDKSSLDGRSEHTGSVDDSEEHLGKEEIVASDYQRLVEIADIMERGVKVSDNTNKAGSKSSSKKVSYKNTFVGARAVTFMVTSGLAGNREEAQKLGRRLELEFNLFTEVTGKYDFRDCNHYYKFTDKQDRITKPMRVEKPLEEIADIFEKGIVLKDNTHRLKTYKHSFSGSKAVDFLVNSRMARDRSQAVRIGCQLVYFYNLFENVTGNRDFCDDHHFFRFTPESERLDPGDDARERRRKSGGLTLLMDRSRRSRAMLVPRNVSQEMLGQIDSFIEGTKVKENKFRGKSYPKTFVGSEAVSYMVNSSLAKSRKHAVDLGKSFIAEVGLFVGIDGAKDFKDDYLLYRFSERFEDDVDDEETFRPNARSLPLDQVAEQFRAGVKVCDHKSHKRIYHETFLGSEAIDFLVGAEYAQSRPDAVDLGRSLAKEFNLIKHATHEKRDFEDEDYLYKFCYQGEIRQMQEIEMDPLRIMNIAKDFESSVRLKDNKVGFRVFKNTFLGTDAVDYLVYSNVAGTRLEAVQIGRAVTKSCNLFEHVTNSRKFEDADIPYFFVQDSERYKGLNLSKVRAKRNIFAALEDDGLSSGEDDEMASSSNRGAVGESITFQFATEDREWADKMAAFESKMHSTMNATSTKHIVDDDASSVDSSVIKALELKKRFMKWSSKFRKLDPRYQIEYFFDFVAQDGAEDVEAAVMEVDNLRPLFNFLPNRASVFTVWRPTSLDAIRKMMLGEAVGKGLDIKGKSAKRGRLSGFVPFLQIGENKHKNKIRPPSKEGVVRVFYPGHARRGRDVAAERLERVALEMIQTVEDAKKALADPEIAKSARKDALDAMLLDMGPDPSITYIDECAPSRFGIEIPERLFWEAYFVRQDCTRKPGSIYDTGRPSQPAFQDMNFAAIRAEPKEGAPRAVVYQGADVDNPMNPFELLVAYEEDNRVMPVVSDFDCFLVGTKRVGFTSPMADSQMSVLKWYMDEIENVMKTSKVGDSWTVNWLEVLKKAAREGFYPEMPRFGFGDPKSYSIMENAVTRLSHSGAVRHGAECFNYYFPQDLDDEFLVIANDLPDNKPWAYVDVEGLQDILEKKIDQGYTFPLNPKWVLCDSFRWKALYDKLLLSDKAETRQSMDIWFPPQSGLREQIERIHERRPNGFYADGPGAAGNDDSSTDSEGSGGGGAKDMMSTVVALRLLEKFQAKTKKFQAGKNDDDGNNGDDSD